MKFGWVALLCVWCVIVLIVFMAVEYSVHDPLCFQGLFSVLSVLPIFTCTNHDLLFMVFILFPAFYFKVEAVDPAETVVHIPRKWPFVWKSAFLQFYSLPDYGGIFLDLAALKHQLRLLSYQKSGITKPSLHHQKWVCPGNKLTCHPTQITANPNEYDYMTLVKRAAAPCNLFGFRHDQTLIEDLFP